MRDPHVFAIEWTSTQNNGLGDENIAMPIIPRRVRREMDGSLAQSSIRLSTPPQDVDGLHPFQDGFYLILTCAIGGDWPEAPDPRNTRTTCGSSESDTGRCSLKFVPCPFTR